MTYKALDNSEQIQVGITYDPLGGNFELKKFQYIQISLSCVILSCVILFRPYLSFYCSFFWVGDYSFPVSGFKNGVPCRHRRMKEY